MFITAEKQNKKVRSRKEDMHERKAKGVCQRVMKDRDRNRREKKKGMGGALASPLTRFSSASVNLFVNLQDRPRETDLGLAKSSALICA